MIFRRQPSATPRVVPPESLETRLRALGYLLDQRGYGHRGLCILEADDGFEINGLPAPGAPPIIEQRTTYIAAEELRAAIAALAATP